MGLGEGESRVGKYQTKKPFEWKPHLDLLLGPCGAQQARLCPQEDRAGLGFLLEVKLSIRPSLQE